MAGEDYLRPSGSTVQYIPRAPLLWFGARWRQASHAAKIIRAVSLRTFSQLRPGSVLFDGDRDQPQHAHLCRRPGHSCRGYATLHGRPGRSTGGLFAGASQRILQALFAHMAWADAALLKAVATHEGAFADDEMRFWRRHFPPSLFMRTTWCPARLA